MDLSSNMVLEEAKIPRKTAGVTGILLLGGGTDVGCLKVEGVTVRVDEDAVVEGLIMSDETRCRQLARPVIRYR